MATDLVPFPVRSVLAELECGHGTKLLRGVGICHGSFGELLQGMDLRDDFLVTCPIDVHARASFCADPTEQAVRVLPPGKTKTAQLANRFVGSMGLCGGALILSSELREGAGCSSSSADMVAAARAISATFGIEVPLHHVETQMLDIEPTDGVMYDSCTLYRFRSTGFERDLGNLPPITLVALDEGGSIDTQWVERSRQGYSIGDRLEFERLLARLTRAIACRRIDEIGAVATRSAEINESRFPKQSFSAMMDVAKAIAAHGLVTTHSGTGIALLLDRQAPGYQDQVSEALARMSRLQGDIKIYNSLEQGTGGAS
ncbi:MAG: hypothetical protein ABJG14_02350 [Sulfitobacter sp.]|uniref:GHMP family kinase ATP-binding protein n=1 Tax=Roseibium sp. TaxID=1936156 RepID=UPI003264FF22